MTEQRYKAVLAVIGDGRTVDEVAREARPDLDRTSAIIVRRAVAQTRD